MNDQKEFLYTETLNSHFCSTSFFSFSWILDGISL